jgi:hypothetical protein
MQLKLQQLKDIYTDTNHIFETILTNEEWLSQNKPHIWWRVEIDGDLMVLSDSSYGRIALFNGEKLIESSKTLIVTDNVVIIDKNYYPVLKYIWR